MPRPSPEGKDNGESYQQSLLPLNVFLVDGTYELFRYFFAIPSAHNIKGEEVAATRGVLGTIASMLEHGARYIGVATDHVIESFRNDLWPGYKTSEGVEPSLLAQFPLVEEALEGMGVKVWPMVELEADDALAGAAASLAKLKQVSKIVICSPDKDLAQCVHGNRVLQLNRRTMEFRNEQDVRERFGVDPGSIPDYLALVGDSADGYPGLAGWGEKSAGKVVGHYQHLEKIPLSAMDWQVHVRSSKQLASTLREQFKQALLFRDLATLRTTEPKISYAEELRWRGPAQSFAAICKRLDYAALIDRINSISVASKVNTRRRR